MKDNRRTLGISKNIYIRFKAICNASGLKISKHAEKVLLEYIEKMEKNIATHK